MKQQVNRAGSARLVAAAIVISLSAAHLFARDKSADKLLVKGREAEQTRQYDQAVELYEQALGRNPADAEALLCVRRARFQAGQMHVGAGQKIRSDGNLELAIAEFEKAALIDPSSSVSLQELRRTQQMLQKKKGLQSESAARPELTPAQAARLETQTKLANMQTTPELRPIVANPGTLRIPNQSVTILYETVGKLAGINVVFDPDVKTQIQGKFSIDLQNSALPEALDYLAMVTKTFWKPVSSNAIFVTLENPTKRRDYENQAVKVFYLQNTTTQQEVTDISSVLRTIIDMKRIFIYPAQNAIVIRGSTDQVALAEKLIYDLDKPKPEVVVDVIVMEASKSRSHDIALGLTSSSGMGLSVPIGFNSGATTSTSTSTDSSTTTTSTSSASSTSSSGTVTLAKLGHLASSNFALTLPGAQFSLIAGDSKTRILQSPQVRAADNQKATLKVGERIPIATGSYSAATAATTAVSPLVSTQFNYQDVGVNVDITPHIHGTDEVSMHVEIEISNVDGYSNLGGLSEPIIGQRKIIHDVRMHEGEVNILGGLQQKQTSRSNSGLPGLVKIPLLRALFGEDKLDNADTDILIALVPHIIRTSNLDSINMRTVSVGNDANLQIRKTATETVQPPAPVPSVPATLPISNESVEPAPVKPLSE